MQSIHFHSAAVSLVSTIPPPSYINGVARLSIRVRWASPVLQALAAETDPIDSKEFVVWTVA